MKWVFKNVAGVHRFILVTNDHVKGRLDTG
jgi:hypothetical protein